jgi:hypothetical protein
LNISIQGFEQKVFGLMEKTVVFKNIQNYGRGKGMTKNYSWLAIRLASGD